MNSTHRPSWELVSLNKIAEINPSFDRTAHSDGTEVSFIPMKRVSELTGKVDLSETRRLVEVKKGFTAFQDGDIIFAKITPCMENGKIAVLSGLKNGLGFGSTEFHVIRLPKELPKEYLFFFLVQEGFRKNAERNMTGSVGQRRVPADYLKATTIPIPPLPEQHRIVNKVEELFTQLDAGVELLQKTKVLLNQYRQSVLKAAFEGKLTEEWRETNAGNFESIDAILERMFKDPKTKVACEDDLPSEVPSSPILPDSWRWARVANVSASMDYGTSEKATGPSSGIPVLRMGNIQSGKLDFGNLKFFPTGWSEFKKFRLEPGDVLFNRTNSAELVGKTAVYKKHHSPAVFASYLIRVKVNIGFYHPDILSHFINSCFGRAYIKSVVSQQVGQANVNGTKLSLMSVPLIPIREQIEILKQVDTHLSIADKFEESLSKGLGQTETIKQAILHKAFQGKLIPQDPDDEPASRLLEKLKADRSAETPKGRKPRQTKMF